MNVVHAIRTEKAVASAIARILSDLTGDPDLSVDGVLSLRDLPHWSSIKQIEAIASAEEEFGVEVHVRDWDRISTVGDLVGAILRATPSP